jgi:adenine-specific DNA-methyltransferase
MNFIEFESEQKLRGGFYTEPALAAFLVRWIKAIRPKSLLEPSCGDGAFLEAIERVSIPTLRKIIGCELDSKEAAKATGRTHLKPQILNRDFLRWYLLHGRNNEEFDAIVGNPPFIRYQYLPNEQQLLAEKIFEQLRLPFTKHTNAWVPFVLASVKLLRPGGRLAMVIPSEIFHIPHAQSLRRYLAEQCSRILIVDPQEIWFGETLQGTTLLLAEKKSSVDEKSRGVAIIAVSDRKILATDPEALFQRALYWNGSTIEGKWMSIFLSVKERALISTLREHEDIKRFSDTASVDVGIVTGANKFFLVPDEIVEEFALQKWAHPMFGRSEHVSGLIYSKEDHRANRRNGLSGNFLWFNKDDVAAFPPNVQRYLKRGLSEKLHTRFKCRTRKLWYQVPSVYVAPIAMLKRAHHYPRLVLNAAGAYTTDTAYRITPLGATAESLVFSFVNSLTCLCAEMEGRHYGGGVLELVPSEIERLLVPIVKVSKQELHRADEQFRAATDRLSFLKAQDRAVFPRLGVSIHEQEILNSAWLKLRDRRHRVSASELDQAVA